MPITWLDKIDGLDLGNPQKNVNASDMNQIKNVANATETAAAAAQSNIDTHEALTNNPHSVTKTQVGLSNVENISINGAITAAIDALIGGAPGALDTLNELAAALGDDASFSTAVTNALALKAPLASPTFTGTVSGITKTMVGLGNVDNTPDTAKPVSTAQQTALDLKLTKTDDVWGEVPSGTVNGINDTFTIANTNPSKKALYCDGIRTNPSNFSITGTTLTITNAAVIPTNSILIDYIK